MGDHLVTGGPHLGGLVDPPPRPSPAGSSTAWSIDGRGWRFDGGTAAARNL